MAETTLKERIDEWNGKSGSLGIFLPMEEKHYIEIGEDIIILKDFDFEIESDDAKSVKAVVAGLAINAHSTRMNLATVKTMAAIFKNENIRFEFDFANFILKIIISNHGKEESRCVLLYNGIKYFMNEDLKKFDELLRNVRKAGIEICNEIGAEDLKEIFEK